MDICITLVIIEAQMKEDDLTENIIDGSNNDYKKLKSRIEAWPSQQKKKRNQKILVTGDGGGRNGFR